MNGARARRPRPALVWVVFLWTLLTSGYTLLSFWLIHVRAISVSPEAAAYLAGQSALDRAGTALVLLLNLGGAVTLLMLRRVAFTLFAAALLLNLLLTLTSALSRGFLAALGGAGAVGLIVGFLIGIGVCVYAFTLRARGVLA